MRDLIFKLKCLFTRGLFTNPIQHFTAWKEFVWDLELDQLACCDGRDCACMAVTNRKYITWQWLGKL